MLTSKLMISNTYVIFDHQLFAVLWRSLKAYISAINLQHWLMTSGGQSRSTIYFCFWISSKFRKDGEREKKLSIKRLCCLSYTGHFKTKCKTGLCSIMQASKLVFEYLFAISNFFVQCWSKNVASCRMDSCESGLSAEWLFRSQNAIEASDSPLTGGLRIKRLITHTLYILAYSDMAWYSPCDQHFPILTMKGLNFVFLPTKHHIVYWLIRRSIAMKLTLK